MNRDFLERKEDITILFRLHFTQSSVLEDTHLCAQSLSHVQLFATPQTAAHQVLLSMGSSRQEPWTGLPCPPSGHLPNSEIEPVSLTSPALAGWFFTTGTTLEAPDMYLLLLLLSRFSRVLLCATPQTAAHQAPPSL